MELNPPTPLSAISWDLVVRLVAAALVGLLLGIDREVRGRPAGLRTHAIVCTLGSLVTVSSIAMFQQLGGQQTRVDPIRTIEGTLGAIGIVAAAVVVMGQGGIRNLTSAVHLVLVAAIGIALGAGLYPVALIGTLLAFALLTLARFIERKPGGASPDAES